MRDSVSLELELELEVPPPSDWPPPEKVGAEVEAGVELFLLLNTWVNPDEEELSSFTGALLSISLGIQHANIEPKFAIRFTWAGMGM